MNKSFDDLVEKYWIAVTSEYWSLAHKVSKELQDMGAGLVEGKWVYNAEIWETKQAAS